MAGEREAFSDYVRRMRVAQRMSLEDVRRESGYEIAASYVNKIENGEISPSDISLGKLLSLAKGLGVEPDVMLDVARGISTRSVEVTPEMLRNREARAELMKVISLDLPDDCQLDTLASLLGVHARRGLRLKIHERSGARAAAYSMISQLIGELLPARAGLAEQGSPVRKGKQEKEGSALASQQPTGTNQHSEKSNDEANDKNGPLRKTA